MINKAIKLIINKPKRAIPHLKTRLAYLASGVLRGYANFPHTIYIGITNKCNLSCKMCDLGQGVDSVYGQHLSPPNDLPLEIWKKFIDQVAPYKPAIEFCAAEPLLYRDLISLVRYIKQDKNLECRIFTNGYLLEQYADVLNQANIDRLIVSVDGPADIHDRIRNKPELFNKVMLGLGKIQNSGSQKAPAIDINYTISEHNYAQINSTLTALKNKGIKFDRFTIIQTLYVTKEIAQAHNRIYPEYPVAGICEIGVDFKAIDTAILRSQMIKAANDYPGVVRFYPDFDPNDIDIWYNKPGDFVGNSKCLFLWTSANIRSDGEVIPYVRCADIKFGNITQENFYKIWNCHLFRRFRLTTKKSLFPICARCSASFMR